MKFILLTHERELSKPTNTGRLVTKVLGDQVEIIVWKRKEPDLRLLHLLETKQAALVFPDSLSEQPNNSSIKSQCDRFEFCVILDSTWQEARKMFNRSQYLKDAEKLSINTSNASKYSLRRNQIEGGLSTAECVMEILLVCGQQKQVCMLKDIFTAFNKN